jgi:hypothetical protein
MKKFALKALAAACLMGPLVAFAAIAPPTTAELDFSEFSLSNGSFNVFYQATWFNTIAKKSGFSDVAVPLTSVTWDLQSTTSSFHSVGQLADVTTGADTLSFLNLHQGTYHLSLNAAWTAPSDGWTVINPEGSLSGPKVSPVPEPESYALILVGLGLIGAMVSRRRKMLDAA